MTHLTFYRRFVAGVPGFEPGLTVLETAVLAANTIPLYIPQARALSPCLAEAELTTELLRLLMGFVASAPVAKLLELQSVRRLLLVLGCDVVAILALRTLKNYVVSRHKVP
jgi:hypothetical protein